MKYLDALKRPLTWIIILAFMVGIGVWWWHEKSGEIVSFQTAVLKRGDVSTTINSTGTLEPIEVVDVGAQVAGLISSFGTDLEGKPIDYRSVVDKGTVLAKIDSSVYEDDLAVAKAQLAHSRAAELSSAANVDQAKAKYVQAEAEWKRAQLLTTSKTIALTDCDTARANYEVAKANVSLANAALQQSQADTVQAQAALDKAQRNLDFCTIKSPVKGVIIDRRVNIGQTVVSSLNAPSLFLIARDLTKMQIWVSVNEADVGRIVPGLPVTFTCDTFRDKEFSGKVVKVRLNANMTQNVVMFTVEINTDNPDNLLLPYLTANVHFIVQKDSDVLLVPNQALHWSPSSLAEVAPDARSTNLLSHKDSIPRASGTDKPGKKATGTIWIKDGQYARPVSVTLGASDVMNTSVAAENLREGQEVIIGEISANSHDAVKNPFLPPVIKR